MNHAYELLKIQPEGSTFKIPKYYDVCLKISFQTEGEVKHISGFSLETNTEIPEIPFKKISENDYLIDEMFDLSRCLIITNVIVKQVITLGIFFAYTFQIEKLGQHKMSQSDLYKYIKVPEPIIPINVIDQFTRVIVHPGRVPPVKFAAMRYKKDQKVTFLINGIYSHINSVNHPFLHVIDGEYEIYSLSPGYTQNKNETFNYNAERLDMTLESNGPVELLCI